MASLIGRCKYGQCWCPHLITRIRRGILCYVCVRSEHEYIVGSCVPDKELPIISMPDWCDYIELDPDGLREKMRRKYW